MKKRLLSLLLCACMVITLLPTAAQAEEIYTYGAFNYVINDDGTAKVIVFQSVLKESVIVIPSEFDGRAVTVIGEAAFKNNTFLTSVTIPSSVKVIEKGAFEYCRSLTSLTLQGAPQSIDIEAFFDCPLQTVYLPVGASYPEHTFSNAALVHYTDILSAPERLLWSNFSVSWSPVSGARDYQVAVYRQNEEDGNIRVFVGTIDAAYTPRGGGYAFDTIHCYADLSSIIRENGSGIYTFHVRSLAKIRNGLVSGVPAQFGKSYADSVLSAESGTCSYTKLQDLTASNVSWQSDGSVQISGLSQNAKVFQVRLADAEGKVLSDAVKAYSNEAGGATVDLRGQLMLLAPQKLYLQLQAVGEIQNTGAPADGTPTAAVTGSSDWCTASAFPYDYAPKTLHLDHLTEENGSDTDSTTSLSLAFNESPRSAFSKEDFTLIGATLDDVECLMDDNDLYRLRISDITVPDKGNLTLKLTKFGYWCEELASGKTIAVRNPVLVRYWLTVIGGTGGGLYNEGETVTISANETASGLHFKQWAGADGLVFTEGTNAASATAKFTMPTKMVSLTAVYEELMPGETYWFNLSDELTMLTNETNNHDMPDYSLHWVPFTYTGTIHAYKLTSQAGAVTSQDYADENAYYHSLFLSDYVVTRNISWNVANENGFIFGKDYSSGGMRYTLRSLSTGSARFGEELAENERAIPENNEWDTLLTKSGAAYKDTTGVYIKNWYDYTMGQDLNAKDPSFYITIRGGTTARHLFHSYARFSYYNGGFRPVLEPKLSSEELRAVTVELNGGSIGTTTGTVKLAVQSGTAFLAPASEGLTRPAGNTGTYFQWRGSNGRLYAPGASVDKAEASLTAIYEEPPAYTLTVQSGTGSGSFTAGTEVTITANAAATGWRFKEWTGLGNVTFLSGSAATATATFLMPEQNVSVMPVYEKRPTHTVTVSGGTGGGDYFEGAKVIIRAAEPESNLRFKEWAGASGLTFLEGSADTAYAAFQMPTTDVTLTATYEAIPAAVRFCVPAGMGVSGESSVTVNTGEVIVLPSLTGAAPWGYRFSGWVCTEYPAEIGADYLSQRYYPDAQYTVQGDVTFYALFERRQAGEEALLQVEQAPADWSGTYGIGGCAWQTDDDYLLKDDLTAIGCGTDFIISYETGKGEIFGAGEALRFTIAKTADGCYSIRSCASGKYLALDAGAANALAMVNTADSEAAHWTLSFDNDLEYAGITSKANPAKMLVFEESSLSFLALTATLPEISSDSGMTLYLFKLGVSRDRTYYTTAPACTHLWVLDEEASVAATCSASGSNAYVCAKCSQTKSEQAEKLPHTPKADKAAAPTCTDTGLSAGSHCSVCGEILIPQTVVAALGHDIVTDNAVAPTCTETGLTEGSHCSRCNEATIAQMVVAALSHAWNEGEVTVKPLSTTTGIKTFTCTRCGEKKTEELPATGKWNNPFIDVVLGKWYYSAVEFAVTNGLFFGTSENTFSPDGDMTRAMLVTVLWRLDGNVAPTGSNPFTDVPSGKWYTDAVVWAAENGVVTGIGNNKFDPEGSVTREQMAAILYRYAGKKGYDTAKRADLSGFPDASRISNFAKDALSWANAEGLINGSDGELLPRGNATRAQVAAILMRYVNNIVR